MSSLGKKGVFMRKTRQLKYKDRIIIQNLLENKISISQICEKINVSKQTIYREIKRNSKNIKNNKSYINPNIIDCKNRLKCEHLFNSISKCHELCRKKCDKFIQNYCDKLVKFPFVCNKCEKKGKCRFEGKIYDAEYANEQAKTKLSVSRSSLHISEEEFNFINDIVSPLLIENKQSLSHILTSHPEISVNERTIRIWIEKGYMSARIHNLPKKIRFNTKKNYQSRIVKPKNILENRTYSDFKKYKKENPQLMVSQMDTVVGLITDKQRVLTIHFPSIQFQFGILLPYNSERIVIDKLMELKEKIPLQKWKDIFAIILCDNGIEFNKLPEIEVDNNTGELISKVFYTDPYRSNQKAQCERNHEYFRLILPKSNSFEFLTQEKVNTVFSHINCVYRPSLPGIRPFDLALQIFGKDFLDAIGITEVKPDDVKLSKSLVKKIK